MTDGKIKTPEKIDNEATTLLARVVPYTNKSLTEKRDNPIAEFQRKTAVDTIKDNAAEINRVAKKYNIRPEAIAVAIAWEGAENYKLLQGYSTPVAGRVHSNTAKSMFNLESRIPRDYTPDRLNEPKVAIEYIGAIMNENAGHYDRIGVNIRGNAPILAQLYQSGTAAPAAKKLRAVRNADRQAGRPLTEPKISYKVNSMGEYAENSGVYPVIRQWLGTTKDYGPYGMGENNPDSSNQQIAAKNDSDLEKQLNTEQVRQNIAIFSSLPTGNGESSATIGLNDSWNRSLAGLEEMRLGKGDNTVKPEEKQPVTLAKEVATGGHER
jgi:hypothetical protein